MRAGGEWHWHATLHVTLWRLRLPGATPLPRQAHSILRQPRGSALRLPQTHSQLQLLQINDPAVCANPAVPCRLLRWSTGEQDCPLITQTSR